MNIQHCIELSAQEYQISNPTKCYSLSLFTAALLFIGTTKTSNLYHIAIFVKFVILIFVLFT